LARELIDAAAESKAEYIKFQTYKTDSLVTRVAKLAKYQANSSRQLVTQYELLKKYEMSDEMHLEVIAYCNKKGIKFLSTGFDIPSVDYLISKGVEKIKIPSGEITNLPLVRHIGGAGKKIILSSGMATFGEVENAIGVLLLAGAQRSDITLLHCTSEYPAEMSGVNLKAMTSMGMAFGVDVGYSDHTLGSEVSIAAVAIGAKLIEKHFTISNSLEGPDHAASIEPDQLREMISSIRNIEIALGDGVKKPTNQEILNGLTSRKSIVAAENIQAGEVFTDKNLTTKRPGSGLSPMRWDDVMGTRASRNFSADEMIVI